jgi:hypothetical protein
VEATKDLEAGLRAILTLAENAGIELPGILRGDPMAHVPDVTFNSIAEALEKDPDTYGTENAMRWKLRYRKENGLMACGAVTERFNGKKGERPRYTIHHRQWVKHLRGIEN